MEKVSNFFFFLLFEDSFLNSNEVKSGGSIPEKAKRIIFHVKEISQLSRFLVKSETATMLIPELELELSPTTLGGKFTTVEGILKNIFDSFRNLPFFSGDSSDSQEKEKFQTFLHKLSDLLQVSTPFTIILDDPLSNSFIENLFEPKDDPNLQIIEYERSEQQNQELGLSDLIVDNY